MKSLKQTLLMACLFFGGFSYHCEATEDQSPISFESRLQHIHSLSQEERLHNLFDLYWEWRMAENPADATWFGFPGQNHRWPDLTVETFYRQQGFMQLLLQELSSIDISLLDEKDLLSHQILTRDLNDELKEASFKSYYMPINQMHGLQLWSPGVIAMMPYKTVEDYENLITRLHGFKVLILQTIALLEKGLDAGISRQE